MELSNEEQCMNINEEKDEYDEQKNIDIANEEYDVLINDEENLNTIEENEWEYDSLNDDIESTESEEHKSSEIEERISSHGIPVRENSGSGVERLEISLDGKSYSHNTHWQFNMIKREV